MTPFEKIFCGLMRQKWKYLGNVCYGLSDSYFSPEVQVVLDVISPLMNEVIIYSGYLYPILKIAS